MNIDPNLVSIISILAMALVSGIAVWRKRGDIQAGATQSIRDIIGNEALSTSVEARLSAIPVNNRNAIIEFVEMASPLTDTTTISKDAAQWIQNMLDGNVATGAIASKPIVDPEIKARIEAAILQDPKKD